MHSRAVSKNHAELGNLYYTWNVLLICLAARPIEIYCSNPAAQQLKGALSPEILEKSYRINIVKGDECLDLGGGENALLYTGRQA